MVKSGKTRKTRKVNKGSRVLTIPELRKAFDHMDKVVESLRKVSKQSFSDAVIIYREEWRKTFKRDISPADASAYLKFRFNTKGAKTRRTKMRGGSPLGGTPLGGAPLGYSMAPGVQGVYGNFPTYQTQGLDRYYANSLTADCGQPNKFPTDGSAAQQGGLRFFESTNPATMGYKTEMTHMGVPAFPTSDATGLPALRTIPASYISQANLGSALRMHPVDVSR